jgi:hypothetical protein
MWAKGSRYWLLLLVPVVIGLVWLYFNSGPRMVVERNTTQQTMQHRLEADNVFVSYNNEPRYDAFKEVFAWTILIDGVSFNEHKYSKDHPGDHVRITGNKPGEERCYIFTNRNPPVSINELTMYLYR